MAKQRHTENTTETGDEILIGCLLRIVGKEQLTDYIKVKEIHELMVKQFGDPEPWLTNKWIGNALRRLGFTDKRRVGTGYEYKISYSDLQDLKNRMQVEEPKGETETEEQEMRACFLCQKLLPNDHINVATLDGKEVHLDCYQRLKEGMKEPKTDLEHGGNFATMSRDKKDDGLAKGAAAILNGTSGRPKP